MSEPPPPPEALAWAAASAAPGARVQAVRWLAGGTHAATHLVETVSPRRELVLRRFPPGDGAAAHEARVLTALDGLGGRAPRLVAADPDGSRCGRPATLITRLPGRADITPASPVAAAVQLGQALARLHAVPVDGLAWLRDGMAAALASRASRGAGAGPVAAVLDGHERSLTAARRVLTHYDYWSGNVLWQDGTLTGVVDWAGASLAPRGFDVSWCRLDLVLLHGPEAADAFSAAYRQAAGEAMPDLTLWDLFALGNSHDTVETWMPNYRDLGRADLTAAELRRRHTAWTEQCLARHRGETGG